jgi:hypothetical protein
MRMDGAPRGRRAALAAAICLLGALAAGAQQRLDFDHFRTGFPLTGAHERVPCEACHTGGVFEGTPSACGTCHEPASIRAATAKPPDHIPTSNLCGDCHVVTTWSEVRFDHRDVTGSCMSCHNGAMADGKPASHIVTSQDCGVCHRTLSWSPARFDHEGITTGCFQCHNGSTATGKPPSHPPTGNDCETCHDTRTWANARFDHTGITTGCFQCHNGAAATGKPPSHPPSSNDCETCHDTNSWATAGFDHTGITTGCIRCHDGATAIGKPPSHPPSGNDCEMCHDTRTFAGATFDHSRVTGSCMSCHNGTTATGKGAGHFVTSQDCNACHATTRWTPVLAYRHASPAYPDHGARVACRECHTANTEVATWPFAGFKPDCAGCHFNDFRPGPHRKTESPETFYTASELRDCSGACHVYRDATLTSISRSRSGEHSPRGGEF